MAVSAKNFLSFLVFVYLFCAVLGITNNADVIWYDESGNPQNYSARQPIPEGLVSTYKIVVKQKLPVLWEVKFTLFNNLKTLLLDDCEINEMKPNTFKDLLPITDLSLSMNNVRELQEGVFNFVHIKNLNLSHNKISIIAPGAFDNMPVLERLLLDFNELKHWNSNWFFNLSNIKTISIANNLLEELPEKSFKNFQRNPLVNFYFSYNKMHRLHPKTLEESGTFGDFFLDWNDLESGLAFANFTSIEHLNLTGNSIHYLSDPVLRNIFNRTKILSIGENPLGCDRLAEIQEMGKKSQAKVELSEKQLRIC